MTRVISTIAMSLDGFTAGPDPSTEDPLGRGGMQLHEWAFKTEQWRRQHGLEGGEETASDAVIAEQLAATGAFIMGRNMFSGGFTPSWDGDPNSRGWWGDEPPFHAPVFVLTHHAREPLALTGTTFTFVTDGIEAAVEQARAAAGGKDVHVSGGADAIQQTIATGLLDTLEVHLVPVVLGAGRRLFEHLGAATFEPDRVVEAPGVTHLRYRVRR